MLNDACSVYPTRRVHILRHQSMKLSTLLNLLVHHHAEILPALHCSVVDVSDLILSRSCVVLMLVNLTELRSVIKCLVRIYPLKTFLFLLRNILKDLIISPVHTLSIFHKIQCLIHVNIQSRVYGSCQFW